MPRRITTEQAPEAKPTGISKVLTEDWTVLVDAPEYDVPIVGFFSGGTGGDRQIRPGAAEMSSPLIVACVGEAAGEVYVRIRRTDSSEAYLAFNMPVEPRDSITIPLNGQFLLAGDVLEARAGSESAMLHVTVSWTEGQAEEDEVENTDV